MICPYLKKIIHVPALVTSNKLEVSRYAEDVPQFRECVQQECPFYYTMGTVEVDEHCRRAESEVLKYGKI